ncbi:MAG: ABC transporter permease [Nitrospirae bacterium]|nr:ABC transporter permease [Nitrospirota bacterium]
MNATIESGSVIDIHPTSRWRLPDWAEIWNYRELLYFLIWRDIKVRYKQTAIGAAWAIIQPFFTMVVFSLFFGKLARIPSDGQPYPVFSYVALLPWTYFSNALSQSTQSIVSHQNLITKIYVPRLILPLSSVVSGLVDLAIAFGMLLLLMVYFRVAPTAAVWTLPLFILLAMMTALGVGLWLCALNVKYRDVRYVLGFLVQFWMFATPVVYPASLVPEKWRTLYGLNPMAGVVEGFRWALLGTPHPAGGLIAVSTAVVLAVLAGGLLYFRRMERTFADVI